MRATLEQLKAMSDMELGSQWYTGKFPFDAMDRCGKCLASHSIRTCQEHGDIAAPPFKVTSSAGEAIGAYLRPHLEEYWAARLFHEALYPQPKEAAPQVEHAQEKTIAESAPSLVAQG